MVTALSASLLARLLMSMTATGTIRLRTGICSRVWVLAKRWQGASMCVPLWSMSSHLLTYTPNFSRVAIAVILIGNVRPGMGMRDAAEGRHGDRLLLEITPDSDHAGRASTLGCRCPGV